MNSYALKLILLTCLLFQAGCGITFKRKTANSVDSQAKISEQKNEENKKLFNKKDSQIIKSYYLDKENTLVRHDMIMQTKTTKKEEKKLLVNENIPRDIQVIPLPLTLERKLSSLPVYLLRVQVGVRVILMNVRSRLILDIIKI